MFENLPDVLTVYDIMEALNIGKNSVYKLLHQNQIKYKKIGRKYLIPKQYLFEFIYSK